MLPLRFANQPIGIECSGIDQGIYRIVYALSRISRFRPWLLGRYPMLEKRYQGIRPPSSVFMAMPKPLPSCPSKFSAGTMQFSMISSQVAEPRIPIFFSFLPIENPGKSFSTIKAGNSFGSFGFIGHRHDDIHTCA